jgi:hypothetical protein
MTIMKSDVQSGLTEETVQPVMLADIEQAADPHCRQGGAHAARSLEHALLNTPASPST